MAEKNKNSQQNIHYSRTLTSDNLSKTANYIGEYVLKGLGAFGKFLNAGFTSPTYGTTGQVSYARNAQDAKRQREQSEASEQALGKAMTWISPLNYGTALATGNGLNARKGEEEVASWSPAWQAAARLGELYVGPKGVKAAKAAPKTVVNAAAKAGSKTAKKAVVAREIKQATKSKPNLSNRAYTENNGNYTLLSPFGEDIGNLLTTKPLTSEMKGKGISMVASKNKGKGVSEDLYNVAVEDSKIQGYPGLESGHDLFRPKLTMHVTDKFPKIETPNVSLQKINGEWQYAPDPNQPPIRLLIGNSGKPIPSKIQELTNHRINLQDLENQRIQFNETTGIFEVIPKEIKQEPSTSLKFFERQPSKISRSERAGVPKQERNFTPKRHIAYYPGYQLKGLMKGSQLEKQLSKNGTININQLNAYFNKASQIEKEVANKVLAEKFAGQKTIDYNQFKKAVQDELIGKYNRVPQTGYADYGMDRLGYRLESLGLNDVENTPAFRERYYLNRDVVDGTPTIRSIEFPYNEVTQEEALQNVIPFLNLPKPPKLSTFTFESPRIPYGNNKHYSGQPIGHSRTYTTSEESNILHVLESQSDWAQNFKHNHSVKSMHDMPPHPLFGDINSTTYVSPQHQYLANNYLQRQLQENLKYAAENGQTKMRYPTSETAAKIEGYQKVNHTQLNELSNQQMKLGEQFENGEISWEEYDKMIDAINKQKKELFGKEYDPKHQTILKKYADFPKLFQKLFKDQKVRTVTDAKGNTWYEVDVPKGYLNREWQFKQGGKMNVLEFLKKGSGIHIKKKNRGKYFKSINKYVNV